MIKRKIIITEYKGRVVTALKENDEIVELHCGEEHTEGTSFSLGSIYIGKVKNIVHNIDAAFVEIANGVECYYALNQNKAPIFTHKIGQKPLCIGDELLVQISREAVKTKAPTVTSNLSFTGKYAVLSTGSSRNGVSAKLDIETRNRLKDLIKPFDNDSYGFVIRTNAGDAREEDILKEMDRLREEYEKLVSKAGTRVCFSCLKEAERSFLVNVRNVYTEGLEEIVVENPDLCEQLNAFLKEHQPEDLSRLRLYEDRLLPLNKLHNIDGVIEKALKEKVWLKTGGYLVIQPTEALTVIDVNSGKCVSKKQAAATYMKINLEAAKEAAAQIRLRNISGIIIIDFINMDDDAAMQQLLKTLKLYLGKDPVQTSLVDVTKLQLVEITRKKVRKPLHESLHR